MKLNEYQLRNIIRNVIKESLNEISPEMKGASVIQADKKIRQLQKMLDSGQRYYKKNGRTVDIAYEIKRLQRQKDNFGNGLMSDVNKSVNFSNNNETINKLKQDIAYYKNRMSKSSDSQEVNMCKHQIMSIQDKIRRISADTGGLRLYGDGAKDGYSIHQDGSRTGRGFGASSFLDPSYDDGGLIRYDNPRDANKAQKLRDITDRMVAYSDSVDPEYMDDQISQAKRQKQYGADLRKYYADKDSYDAEKAQSEREMNQYNSMNPLKRMFAKKPQGFNKSEPQMPDGRNVGHYFQDFTNPDYDGGLAKRQGLRDKYSRINGEQNK